MLLGLSLLALPVWGHGIDGADGRFVDGNTGFAPIAFAYLGAKHMVTGLDHLLFLAGVLFFLTRLRDVALYATLFAIGHSLTLIIGVLADWRVNEHLIDAVIGLSVVYKAWENLGGLPAWRIPPAAAVFAFGLCHGLGLATKLQQLNLTENGLLGNLISFNLGIELGQGLALAWMLLVIIWCRCQPWFTGFALAANWLLLCAGLVLFGFQASAYWLSA